MKLLRASAQGKLLGVKLTQEVQNSQRLGDRWGAGRETARRTERVRRMNLNDVI